MKIRRTTAAAITLTIASTGLATALATSPAQALHTADAQSIGKAGLDCGTQLLGVDSHRKLVVRDIANKNVTKDRVATKRLPFDPSSFGWVGYQKVKGAQKLDFVAINPRAKHPSVLHVKVPNRGTQVTFSADPMVGSMFRPLVYATGGGGDNANYTVDSHGTIKQWQLYQDRLGRLYFAQPRVVVKRAASFKTLAISTRTNVRGAETDVLWGVTRSGGLAQLQVPVNHLDHARLRTVVKTGFEDVSGLSLSFCNRSGSALSIIAVDAKDDTATWYTLTDQFAPRASKLVNRGDVAPDADWNLHTIL